MHNTSPICRLNKCTLYRLHKQQEGKHTLDVCFLKIELNVPELSM